MQLLAISGTVKEGTDNNDTGLAGVTIQLLDSDLNVIKTTITDTDGNYKFDNLVPDE
jgi:serine-aspartate repeat-containing protein C/D/E